MPKTQSLVFPDKLHKAINKRAKQEGTTFSDICRRGIECYLYLDPEVLELAKRLAAAIGCHPMTVISNFAISKIAQRDAEIEYHGMTDRTYEELQKQDGVVMEGDALYQLLKKQYVGDIGQKQRQQRFAKPKYDRK